MKAIAFAVSAHWGWNRGSGPLGARSEPMGARPGMGIESLFSFFLSHPGLALQRRGRGHRTEPSPVGKDPQTPPPRNTGLSFLAALGPEGSAALKQLLPFNSSRSH